MIIMLVFNVAYGLNRAAQRWEEDGCKISGIMDNGQVQSDI